MQRKDLSNHKLRAPAALHHDKDTASDSDQIGARAVLNSHRECDLECMWKGEEGLLERQIEFKYTPELTPIELLILMSLAGGDKHGLGLIQDILSRTRNEVLLVPGTLYAALKRMAAAELIVPLEAQPNDKGDDRRRYYRLTGKGRATLWTEAFRMKHLVDQVLTILQS